MPKVCEVMAPGLHCICHDRGGNCCLCVIGAENCKDDETDAED